MKSTVFAFRRRRARRRASPTRPTRWGWMLAALVIVLAGLFGQYVSDSGGVAAPVPDASASAPPAFPTAPPTAPPSPTASPTPPASPDSAAALLETLPVKGRAPKTGYARAEFGPRWLDVDRNGCDTRNDILGAQLDDAVRKGSCRVLSGTLADPYTGTTIDFVRGQGTSELVQIDHVVALSDAWQKGAQALSLEQRTAFANDPLNLLAVDGRSNSAKGDGDAATWLPKNKAFRCEYVARQVAVKARYELWVTQAEHDAIARVLASCPAQPVPAA